MKRFFITLLCIAFALPMIAQNAIIKWGDEPKKLVTIDNVTCIGDPVSKELLITFNAKANQSNTRFSIGGEKDDFAANEDGDRYKVFRRNAHSTGMKDLKTDAPYTFEIVVKNVDPELEMLEILSLNFSISSPAGSPNTGMSAIEPLKIKSIPIQWGTAPTKNIVSQGFELKAITTVSVKSCTGDKTTGTITLNLRARTTSSKATLTLGQDNVITAHSGEEVIIIGHCAESASKCSNIALSEDVPTPFAFTFSKVQSEIATLDEVVIHFYATDYANDIRVGSNMKDAEPITIKNIPVTWK